MDYPQTNLIIQNPDGSIQLGTQPQYYNKKLITCFNCDEKIVFDNKATMVKCMKCKKVNGVPNNNPPSLKIVQCPSCQSIVRQVHPNQNPIICPVCDRQLHLN